jgi:hypothetical protein
MPFAKNAKATPTYFRARSGALWRNAEFSFVSILQSIPSADAIQASRCISLMEII